MASIISAGTTSGTSLNLSADTSGVLQLATNGTTTAVTIDTSQNVGIGTASPSGKLVVQQANNTGDGIRLLANGTDTQLISRYIASTDSFRIEATYASTGAYKPIVFYTSDAERMRIPAAGGVQSAGSISVGGATPTTSGAGITFPATQSASSDANTLDDYEEGTWTPTYLGGSSNPTVSYQAATSGNYVKIGSLVYCRGTLRTSTVSGGSGDVYIGGLPFTVINSVTEQGFSPVHIYLASNGTFAGDYPLSGQTESGTTRALLLYRTSANGATLPLQINDLATSGENFIKFLIMYNAA